MRRVSIYYSDWISFLKLVVIYYRYPSQNGKNGNNYFTIDAKTFAEWGVDSFKFDGCNEDVHHFDDLYPKMAKALNESGN